MILLLLLLLPVTVLLNLLAAHLPGPFTTLGQARKVADAIRGN